MRWDTRGTVALLISALVGVTAGVVLGFTTGSGGPSQAGDDPTGGVTSGPPDDPLGTGAAMVNLDCHPDKYILVLGYGETRGFLDNAVSANSDADVKYLETARSCNTLYGAQGRFPPTYVAYLGPFDSPDEPCTLRMNVDHADEEVTSLQPGTKRHVECLCILTLNEENFPPLAVGMKATTRDGIYIRALQRLLMDLPTLRSDLKVTGRYGVQTSKEVERLQKLNALDTDPPGSVDLQTWAMLRDRGCVTQAY
jgi:hypothetical protein